METIATARNADRASPARRPRFSGMSHISLPCRDLEETKVFHPRVMGGEPVRRAGRPLYDRLQLH
jgi:hypothetical protein